MCLLGMSCTGVCCMYVCVKPYGVHISVFSTEFEFLQNMPMIKKEFDMRGKIGEGDKNIFWQFLVLSHISISVCIGV